MILIVNDLLIMMKSGKRR